MSVLETLEIRVDAEFSDVTRRLAALSSAMTAARLQSAALKTGLSRGVTEVAAAGRALSAAARISPDTASARAAGQAVASGFANGIKGGMSAVTAAADKLASAAVARIKTKLSIHSPSKVTETLGGYFGEGFIDGIEGTVTAAGRAAEKLSAAAVGGLAAPRAVTPVPSAPSTVDITVPLTIDGVKLGEAAIRGINAVTRRTGRIMLDI